MPTINAYPTEFAKLKNSADESGSLQRQVATFNSLLWVFDIRLDLHTDNDHDGHYSNFSLTLDLDTTLPATTVYAILYLATEGGPWNEYAVTSNFTISGSGSADAFSLQAQLDSGYPSDYYNHHIEIYDAYTDELIGTYGPADSHLLVDLPIESRFHDNSVSIVAGVSVGFGNNTNLTIAGTGAITPGSLCLFAILFLARRRRDIHSTVR